MSEDTDLKGHFTVVCVSALEQDTNTHTYAHVHTQEGSFANDKLVYLAPWTHTWDLVIKTEFKHTDCYKKRPQGVFIASITSVMVHHFRIQLLHLVNINLFSDEPHGGIWM